MRFRVALAITWMLVAVVGIWFLHGGFGIRIPRAYHVPPNLGAWILLLWAALLVGGGGLLLAYLIVKAIQIAAPQLLRT